MKWSWKKSKTWHLNKDRGETRKQSTLCLDEKHSKQRKSNAKDSISTFKIILRSGIIKPKNINIYNLQHFQRVIFNHVILRAFIGQ